MPGGTSGASRRRHADAVTDTANRYQACSFFFYYTFLHFPFIYHFLIISCVPGTAKVPGIETALHSEEVTLPKRQRRPCHPVAPCHRPSQHQDSPEVLG